MSDAKTVPPSFGVAPPPPDQPVNTPPYGPPLAGQPPPTPFASWCDWARDGLAKALDAMKNSSSGVTEYHVGSRGLKRVGPTDQIKNIDYWNQMVVYCCGPQGALPTSLTGRDASCRIVFRDV